MFKDAAAFNQNLSGWNVCHIISSDNYDGGANSWDDAYKPKLGHACVVNVTSPNPDGRYGLYDLITISVVFNREVVVSGGVPFIVMRGCDNSDNTYLCLTERRGAHYTGGSGSKVLNFSYIIDEWDHNDDLNYNNTDSLKLNGSTIQTNGKDAILTLPNLTSPNSLAGNKELNITRVDFTPLVFVGDITNVNGSGSKVVFAVDDHMIYTNMSYKIQNSSVCSAVPINSTNYTEGDNVLLDKEIYNDKYVCFWSEDSGGNVGVNVSSQILGIDKTAPRVTVGDIYGNPLDRQISAFDDDLATTTMSYKIQSNNSCDVSVSN